MWGHKIPDCGLTGFGYGWHPSLATALFVIAGLADGTPESFAIAIAIAAVTTIYWPAISLASVFAGYISVRLQEPAAPTIWATAPVEPSYTAAEASTLVGSPSI